MSMTEIEVIGERMIAHVWGQVVSDLAEVAMRKAAEMAKATLSDAIAALDRRAALRAVGRRAERERASIEQILQRATPPREMDAAPVAPARGPMLLRDNIIAAPGGTRQRDGAHWRGMDRLSIMCRHAYERHAKSGSDQPFVAPFSPGQVSMALHYQALVERHDAAGIKLASIEGRSARSGGASGGGFMEAYLSESAELETIRRRIGDGVAMAVRRVRPSARGTGARSISDRALVDMVCLGGSDLNVVLSAHGWSCDGKNRSSLKRGLADALDRMQGYRKKGD